MVMVMVMVMVLNSAYTGPLPRYLWCSSGAILQASYHLLPKPPLYLQGGAPDRHSQYDALADSGVSLFRTNSNERLSPRVAHLHLLGFSPEFSYLLQASYWLRVCMGAKGGALRGGRRGVIGLG